MADIASIIERHASRLAVPGVLSVRPGSHLVGDWLTDRPAIVVTVEPGAGAGAGLPRDLEGVPVDVRVASEAKRMQLADPEAYARVVGPTPDTGAVPEFAGERRMVGAGILAPEGLGLDDGLDASLRDYSTARSSKTQLAYTPAPGVALTPIEGDATITLSASPDSGWPTLEAFLTATETTLTVGLYDFTSSHVLTTVETVLAGREVKLVLDHPARNPTADQSDEQTVAALTAAFGSKFEQAWALERSDPLASAWIFPSAYHIKVAVRDHAAVWLSSGNWNNSNQPDIDPVATPADAAEARTRDRDWHVVVQSAELARVFEAYLLHDLSIARAHNQRLLSEPLDTAFFPPLVQTPPFGGFTAALTISGSIRIDPLLTPDPGSYAHAVAELIASATTSLHLQFQYIELPKTPTAATQPFLDLVQAVIGRQKAGVEVKIIMSQFETAGYLEQLQALGLDVVHDVKLQNNVHNKGIVVDGRSVLVSSQNWSSAGTLTNRDASVILHSAEAAAYFDGLFLHDWEHLAARKTAVD
ncbi:MAG TPA: phospholipase D-like domain-containing protein [Pseudolysinimonas sp.]|jgi:hypothetical protein